MKSADEIDGLADRFEEVQKELLDLLGFVRRARESLGASTDQLSEAAESLSSIGQATEKAAHNLLGQVEKVMDQDEVAAPHLDVLEKAAEQDEAMKAAVEGLFACQDERTNVLTEMMQELSFQDLTCQTLQKVVGRLAQVEERIMYVLDPQSFPHVEHGDDEHAGSMSGLSRLEEKQQGESRQDFVDQLFGG
ncbi:MAG: protein phosphatase CheZ [Myxococcota bacterium]